MDKTAHPSETQATWREVLAESEADLAAGRIVPGEVVLRDLRDSLTRLEARMTRRRARKKAAAR